MITLSPKYSQLRALNESDLLQVLEWRNHDNIRQWMTNTDIITFENHCNWFKKSNTDKNKLFYIFEYNEQAEGYISLQKIAHSECFEWGFYVRPGAPKGMGILLGTSILDLAFQKLEIQKIFGQVLGFNEKSIRVHTKLGFKLEGQLRNQFQDERGIYDIYQFGLLQTEWLERKKHE